MEAKYRQESESQLACDAPSFQTPGFCFVCGSWTRFHSSWAYSYEIDGHRVVNWREHLLCPWCGLNNRMRASVHVLAITTHLTNSSRVYLTEQSTPLFAYFRRRFPSAVGSEYLGDAVAFGQCDKDGLRNEDLTHLSFPDGVFDAVLSFDVIEHIPDYLRAFAECARILKPGGKMLLSVPFDVNSSRNVIRSRVLDDGSIEHVLPPEYRGDPLSADGCLCFQCFGWEMLEQMTQSGFSAVSAIVYYSRDYGYLGGGQIQFLAEK